MIPLVGFYWESYPVKLSVKPGLSLGMKLLTSLTFKLPLLASWVILLKWMDHSHLSELLLQALCSEPNESRFWGLFASRIHKNINIFQNSEEQDIATKWCPIWPATISRPIPGTYLQCPEKFPRLPGKFPSSCSAKENADIVLRERTISRLMFRFFWTWLWANIFIFFAAAFPLMKDDNPLLLTD